MGFQSKSDNTRFIDLFYSSIAAALQAVIPPLDDSVGAQLLKKMGWRPGQGIGRRLTYEEMKQRNEKEGLPTPAIDDLEATKHTYAPRETRIPKLSRKDDFHGLGYVAMEGLRNSKDREATSGPHLSSMYPGWYIYFKLIFY